MATANDSGQGTTGDEASLNNRARTLYQRLRLVAQFLRDAPSGENPRLLWRESDGTVRTHRLSSEVVIGRNDSCHVVLTQSRVSRRHCRLWIEQGQTWIEDLGSTAGTFVNSCRISRERLVDGDLVDIGGTLFVPVFEK